MAFLVMLLTVVGILGGTLSYRASTALPDDLLYVYKIEVNENIAAYVAHTDEAQARWNLYSLQQRLREARNLAMRGKLDVVAQAKVTANIVSHVQNLTSLIVRLQASGSNVEAAALAVQVTKLLDSEAHAVADTSALGSPTVQVSLAPLLTKLRTTYATMATISTKAQTRVAGSTVENQTPVAKIIPVKADEAVFIPAQTSIKKEASTLLSTTTKFFR